MKSIYLLTLLCICFGCKSQEITLVEAVPGNQQEPGSAIFHILK